MPSNSKGFMQWRSKKSTVLGVLVGLALIVPAFATSQDKRPGFADDQEATTELDELTKIEQMYKTSSPEQALAKLRQLKARLEQEKLWPHWVRASVLEIRWSNERADQPPEQDLKDLLRLVEQSPEQVRPVLYFLAGEWLWSYFEAHRWELLRRPETSYDTSNIAEWDQRRFIKEIDRLLQLALAKKVDLQKQPLKRWLPVLDRSSFARLRWDYYPTLYDLLVLRAVKLYLVAYQIEPRADQVCEISPSDPIFDESAQFLNWTLPDLSTDCLVYRAIKLLQERLAYHMACEAYAAAADADYQRIVFGRQVAVGEGGDRRYQMALERFVKQWADCDLAAIALVDLARLAYGQGDYVRARQLALKAVETYPESSGASMARLLVQEIERPELALALERSWCDSSPEVRITYRNIQSLIIEIFRIDWECLWNSTGQLELRSKEDLERCGASDPIFKTGLELPETKDFKAAGIAWVVPKLLEPGFYALKVTTSGLPPDGKGELTRVGGFWVTKLAVVLEKGGSHLAGWVVDAINGQPIAGATVEVRRAVPVRQTVARLTSDRDGYFRVPAVDQGAVWIIAKANGCTLALSDWTFKSYRQRADREQTFLFTDRSIYRPGQVVYFKGLCIRVDEPGEEQDGREIPSYRVLAGTAVEVSLKDPNGRVIERMSFRCNELGSFSGQFVLPQSGLTGRYVLEVTSGPVGSNAIQVEEYKRPRFYVELTTRTDRPRLNGVVEVHGKAVAYAGFPIDSGVVRYRVVRRCFVPWWSRLFFVQSPGEEKHLAHGATAIRKDGTFQFEFVATADPSIPEAVEPRFTFTIYVDVTDGTGETRSAVQSLTLGYRSIYMDVLTPSWMDLQREKEVKLFVRNLSGDGVRTKGTVQIWSLEQPPRPIRAHMIQETFAQKQGCGSDLMSWPTNRLVSELSFETDNQGLALLKLDLPVGVYRLCAEAIDDDGKPVRCFGIIRVLNSQAGQYPVAEPFFAEPVNLTIEPGGRFSLIWGTGYEGGVARIAVWHRGQEEWHTWTPRDKTQWVFEYPVEEHHRGGFTVVIWQVYENRLYSRTFRIDVPWSNKELDIQWSSFRSNLAPRQRVTWTLIVRPKQKLPSLEGWQAEVLCAMYDRSLDQFIRQRWQGLDVFYRDYTHLWFGFGNFSSPVFGWQTYEVPRIDLVPWTYPDFDQDLSRRFGGRVLWAAGGPGRSVILAARSGLLETALGKAEEPERNRLPLAEGEPSSVRAAPPEAVKEHQEAFEAQEQAKGIAAVRTLLNETAFFYPQLRVGTNGEVRIEFEVPESLTSWRVMALAHDQELRWGYNEAEAITSLDLMILPNPPRFVRENDEVEFSARVVNKVDHPVVAQARLEVYDADGRELGWVVGDKVIEVKLGPRESKTCSWRLKATTRPGIIRWQAVAEGGGLTDGEEGYLPVLSSRIALVEAVPIFASGKGDRRTFILTNLLESAQDSSLRHLSYRIQVTSRPVWYAVLALPYLTEYPYECSEQIFNRYFALRLGKDLLKRFPSIEHGLRILQKSGGMRSPLERNAQLKSIIIEETPWVNEALRETKYIQRLAMFLDTNHVESELARSWQRLLEMQSPDGLWPWFPGGPGSHYISIYILTGFARMLELGLDVDLQPALKALQALDRWLVERWTEDKKDGKLEVGPLMVFYLYSRSLFSKQLELQGQALQAFEEYLGELEGCYLELSWLCQGYAALAFWNVGRLETARTIARFLLDRSVFNPELGRYWPVGREAWRWDWAPIETQALLVEVIDRILNDQEAVDQCRLWLLRQKQTTAWPTTKSTADVVYCLVRRGTDWLNDKEVARVEIDGKECPPPTHVESVFGYYEIEIPGSEILPQYGKVTIQQLAEGPVWGGVYWQYEVALDRVRSADYGPLSITRIYYLEQTSPSGVELVPIDGGAVRVGERVVSRLVVKTDRDLEYVHLVDQRPCGAEPIDVLSGYRWEGRIGYYLSIRDASTHYFFERLPRGTYVFDNRFYIQHAGEFYTGLATIECMYAPEFRAHSHGGMFKCIAAEQVPSNH